MNRSNEAAVLGARRCMACGRVATWPRHACPACGGTAFQPVLVPGGGEIHSVTLVHRGPASGDDTAPPPAVALIALDAGGMLMARVPAGAAIGDRVIASRRSVDEMPSVTLERDQ